MNMKASAAANAAFAARCYAVSRAIHWLTVMLVSGVLVTALFGHIDPHGPGNVAFLWHSSLGLAVYLLSISRVLLWLVYRPMAREFDTVGAERVHRSLQTAFYALLVALPISGWWLASEEGMPAHVFGIPALPQWYYREGGTPSIAIESREPSTGVAGNATAVTVLIRLHESLAAALTAVIIMHLVVVIRSRPRRRDVRLK